MPGDADKTCPRLGLSHSPPPPANPMGVRGVGELDTGAPPRLINAITVVRPTERRRTQNARSDPPHRGTRLNH